MNILSRQPKLKPKPKPKPIRCGFTLVELLFVIAIIAILSTLSLAMIGSAQREARSSATQSRITHIQNILSTYIEDMEFRKLPFRDREIKNWVATYGEAQELREKILVDYLNAEMPSDRVELANLSPPQDLGQFPTLNYPGAIAGQLGLPKCQTALIRQWDAVKATTIGLDGRFPPNPPVALPGELLHKLLHMINFEGENALEALGNGAIGNVDNDDYFEVVDAWGDPLQFQLSLRDPVTGDSVPLNSNNVPLELQNLRFEVWSDNLLGERRVEF